MPEQIFFEDNPDWRGEEEKKESIPIISEAESINCQYCQDVGPCTYCKRGQEEQAQIAKDQKKNQPDIWKKIREASKGRGAGGGY